MDIKDISTSRRRFLKVLSGAGAGLTLAVHCPSFADTKNATSTPSSGEFEPNAFVSIGSDNVVTVTMKHVEMGQGSFTGLTTLIAEELDADWDQLKAVAAPADVSRYRHLHWGQMQGTGGSSAMSNAFMQMREAGATARAMLVAAAAAKWAVAASEVEVNQGVVSHKKSGKKASFGELASLAAQQTIPAPDSLKLKDPKDFIYIGKKVSRMDTGKVDGSAVYTQDVNLPGMLTALVIHPPRFGAKFVSFDAKKALAMNGVVDVVSIPTGVAVIAKDFWSAKTGRDAVSVKWDESEAFQKSSDELWTDYQEMAKTPAATATNTGDAKAAISSSSKTIEVEYHLPFLAHACMEPMNCVALVNDDSAELWYGAQSVSPDQGTVAWHMGLKPEQVKINVLYSGGSFGRRATSQPDYVLEAAQIAKARKGTPIKMVRTREDDMLGGFYRPMALHKIRGGLNDKGEITGWEHTVVSQSLFNVPPDKVDNMNVEGIANLAYEIDNLLVNTNTPQLPVSVLWWRSVGHSHTAFAAESFIDQLAHEAKQDPYTFRMKYLKDKPRHTAVLKLAAEKVGWGTTKLKKDHALGIAVHESFGTVVAEIAEVSLQKNGFKVERVTCAVDCGLAVNPDIVKAQIEGGIGFGLSAALGGEITFKDGRVEQTNFHNYSILRMPQMPEIDVHILPSANPPTGIGEPGTPPITAAVANALFQLTGKRHTKLPFEV